jgi:hypothetical protein
MVLCYHRSPLEYKVCYVNPVTWHRFRSNRSTSCKHVALSSAWVDLKHRYLEYQWSFWYEDGSCEGCCWMRTSKFCRAKLRKVLLPAIPLTTRVGVQQYALLEGKCMCLDQPWSCQVLGHQKGMCDSSPFLSWNQIRLENKKYAIYEHVVKLCAGVLSQVLIYFYFALGYISGKRLYSSRKCAWGWQNFGAIGRYMLHTLKEAWLEEIIMNLALPVYIET